MLCVAAMAGCSDATGSDDGSCRAREDALFTQLNDTAAELLPAVEYDTNQVSGCDSKEQVDPLLNVEIPTWQSENYARRWMIRQGWVRQPAKRGDYAPEYASPDGRFVAAVYRRTGQSPSLIVISLITAAQDR